MINTDPSFTSENDTQTERSRLRKLARRTVGSVVLATVVISGAAEIKDAYHDFSHMQFDFDGILNTSEQ